MDSNIHGVTKFDLGEISELTPGVTYTRKVVIETDDKQVIKFTLFADNKKALKVKVKVTKLA